MRFDYEKDNGPVRCVCGYNAASRDDYGEHWVYRLSLGDTEEQHDEIAAPWEGNQP